MGLLGQVVAEFRRGMAEAHVEPSGGYGSLFGDDGPAPSIPLGTAQWMPPEVAAQRFRYTGSRDSSQFWFGSAFDSQGLPLGYQDDRHVCLVSGSRGGKGAGIIVPVLCTWQGSCIVVDPKGENATVTARRRGLGSPYTKGMAQKVCILDPFDEVQLPRSLKARFNPLDAIDPTSDLAIDDAGRIAAALIVPQSQSEPFWEEAARNLVKGLILHVISAPYLATRRNLVTVRRFLTQGDWLVVEELRQEGTKDLPSAFTMLWIRMRQNPAFNGVVAGVGEQMLSMAEKTGSGVIESARTNTEFLDSVPMQKVLEESDFSLGELKKHPEGLTIYLTLPQRFMSTHYRWLRLMISLAVGEMERLKGRPATGHPTLFLLDEFAGLKKMEVIENAAAQAAGFGVKFCFVVQNLPQLEEIYQKSWETFLGNSGLRLFFQIDDDFTRNYVSRQLGEMETTRQTQSGSQSTSASYSSTRGRSGSENSGRGTTRSPFFRFVQSRSTSSGSSSSWSSSSSRGSSTSTTEGWGEAIHKRPLLNPDEIGRMLARIDDRSRPGYPGVVLALMSGERPLLARRENYFESFRFLGCFDPHPNHPPPPTLAELERRRAAAATPSTLPKPAATTANVSEIIKSIFGLGILLVGGYYGYTFLFGGKTQQYPLGEQLVSPGRGSPPALLKPSNFDCVNGKHMGSDWVICASPQLLDVEARLDDAYRAALAARGEVIRHEQIAWIKHFGTDCGLPYRGRPSPELLAGASDCVFSAMKQRLAELQVEQ
jgi:type IV secretory pathway TraG/TraD family ATPase VirD4/uncharacterized protein YecT (DUF1311 family)